MYLEGKEMDHRYLRAFYGLKEKNITNLTAPFITALVDNLHYIELNWETLCQNIEDGKLDTEIPIDQELREEFEATLEPDPERAEELRRIFREGFDKPFIPKV